MADPLIARADSMAPEAARRLAAVVQPGRECAPGDLLPVLWQWAYFPELEPNEALGGDGHPLRHDEWVERFPRRMAGGGRAKRLAPFVIGEPAERRSELVRAREREGRQGGLVICDWLHTYSQGGAQVLEEIQTVIYRPPRGAAPASDVAPPLITNEPDQRAWDFVRRLEFNPVMLFRFSAATWNSHRIHFARPLATQEEGYAGLLVHGPLLTVLLAREAEGVIGELEEVDFRLQAPTFDTQSVDVFVHQVDETSCQVEARKDDGTVAVSLSAVSLPAGKDVPRSRA
jgi:hydroxyacyl-ACP dehydratase HTD2-like protein with hotdog domain